jgi:hypothetical protein
MEPIIRIAIFITGSRLALAMEAFMTLIAVEQRTRDDVKENRKSNQVLITRVAGALHRSLCYRGALRRDDFSHPIGRWFCGSRIIMMRPEFILME